MSSYRPRSSLPADVLAWLAARLAHLLSRVRTSTAPPARSSASPAGCTESPHDKSITDTLNHNARCGLLKQTRQHPVARKASWISWRRS
jgi:hypothetical protein